MTQFLRISLLFAIAALPSFALAPFNISCQKGAQTVMTSAIPSSTRVQQSYAGATVTVFIHGGAVGVVSTSGTAVTWVSGTQFNANSDWNGIAITINAVSYTITTVTDTTHLTLSSSAGTQTSVAYGIATAKAPIFSDYLGATPQANPLTCSATAGFLVYSPNSILDETFSGTGIAVPFTLASVQGVDPIGTTTGLVTYNASIGTAAQQCTAAFNANQTLIVSQPMAGLATQAMSCATQFLQGGMIQPASGQTVTLAQCPSAAILQIFDTSASGHVAIPDSCVATIQWYGVVADNSTDNATLANEALQYAKNVYLPGGAYRSSSFWTAGIVGQSLTCQSPETSIIRFTGATSGIFMHNGSTALQFNRIENCQITTTSTSVAARYAINNDNLGAGSILVRNNFITTDGSGIWTAGIRFVGVQGGTIDHNRIFGLMTTAIKIGDGVSATTFNTVSNNLVGSLGGVGTTGLDIRFSKNTFATGNYWQNNGWDQAMLINNASDLTVSGDNIESSNGIGTNGILNNGNLRVIGLWGTGTYVNFIDGNAGSMSLSGVEFNGTASGAVILNTAYMAENSSAFIVNSHATGRGIDTRTTASFVGPGVNVSTLAGDAVYVDSAAIVNGVVATSATGSGLECAGNATVLGVTVRDFEANVSDVAHVFTGCSGRFREATGIRYNGNNWIPDVSYATSIAASGANQTITPTSNLVVISGSGTIQTISATAGNTCLDILPAAGSTWTFSGGGNIFQGASRTFTVGITLRMCSFAGTFF